MAERILFPEFYDQYENTPYPFLDSATLRTQNSGQRLDEGIFLDAGLFPVGASGPLYLYQILVSDTEVTLRIADQTRDPIAEGSFDRLHLPELVELRDGWGRCAGVLVSEPHRLAQLAGWPNGIHTFLPNATTFAPSCVIPTPEVGVRGLVTAAGKLLTGDIVLVGDDGVVVRPDPEDGSMIRIDIVGDPLFRRRLCSPTQVFETPRFVKTINGRPPDASGNFNLTVGDHLSEDTVLRIYTDGGKIVIEAAATVAKR